MPGFVQDACITSYGYVDPYIQKTRNAVPLFDKAAQQIEYYVPPVIKQVDHFAEPTIEKLKPTVEPYYNKGVEKAEEIKGFVKPYYEDGVKRVDKAKAVVSRGYEGGARCAEDIREDIQKLVRVKAERNLQDLKTVSTVNKFLTGVVTKLESLMDRYLPAPPTDADTQSDDSLSSDKSTLLPRMQALPFTLMHRIVYAVKFYIPAKEDLTFASLKAKVAPIQVKARAIVSQKFQYLRQTNCCKNCVTAAGRAAGAAHAGCEKLLGKERTKVCLSKIAAMTPASWKAALAKLVELPKAA